MNLRHFGSQVSSHHSLHSRRVSLVPPGSRRMSLVTQSQGSRRMSLLGSRRPSFCIPGLGSRRSSLLSTGGDLDRASSSFNLLPEVDQGADGVVEDVPDQVSAISRIADTQTPVMSLYYKQDDNQVSHNDKWWERFSSKTLLITLIVPKLKLLLIKGESCRDFWCHKNWSCLSSSPSKLGGLFIKRNYGSW